MVSALYAVLCALLLMKYSFDVIRLRTQYQVSFGDGGFYELQTAIRVHGNAIEYMPITLILLVLLEMNGTEIWMIHLSGLLFLTGRILHYFALHRRDLRLRRSAMGATYTALLFLTLTNIYYLPWELILHPFISEA